MRIRFLLGQYPPEEEQRRKDAIKACASGGTEIDFRILDGSFYDKSTGAASAAFIAHEVCKAAVEAEQEGIEAVVTFGTLDPGVEVAAHFVDIPVLGAGRTGYHIAAMIGRRIASIVYTSDTVPNGRALARRFNVDHLVVSIRGIDVGLSETASRRDELRSRLVALAKRAVEEDDAEVIFPQGVSMVPLHCSAEELSELVGVPVIDGLAASVRMAEFFVATGVTNSRVAYPRLAMA